jgi:proteasome lid subunit RPN8/RPN11
LTGTGDRKAMKFEPIFAVSVCGKFIHVFRYVDNLDGLERTLLGALAAAKTEYL